jgi:hypothetical protein
VLPRVVQGWVLPMEGAGLGARLLPGVAAREDAILRVSAA